MNARSGACLTALALAVAAGCGNRDAASPPGASGGSGSAAVTVDDQPLPAVGVDAVTRFGFVYGAGESAFAKATAAAKPKGKGASPDWAAVATACEATLAKDAHHGEAHYLLAVALIQLDRPGAAAHLETAIAQDALELAPRAANDDRLAAWRATPAGKATLARAQRLEAATLELARRGVVILGRRGPFRWPNKAGSQWSTTRAARSTPSTSTRAATCA
ncbi:MAG: hypothetical protein R2939_22675 [Kofleriaceae bacterium]